MHKRAKGNIGENIACTFLEKNSFTVIDRNYQKKWGELDIVAEKDKIIHFFEVKSVTSNFFNVADGHKPEENVHGLKVKHVKRMIETYLDEKKGMDIQFQFHVLSVFMNERTHRARVIWLKNVIL